MTQAAAEPASPVEVAGLEQKVRAQIESLSYLPTTAAVAMKFVELGKDLRAEPADYAKVIGADSSLSSKLLALANSPWFGLPNKVTSVRLAVNLLGLGTVRTMAISYCMAGLHNELRLTQEESRMFWEAALCKAVAAQRYAKARNERLADEAFVGGLFQDFALPVMYATAREHLLPILQDAALDGQAQLHREREVFHLDHVEIGRVLAEKLELPEILVDAVAFHHDRQRLSEFTEDETFANAVYVASLFPPLLNAWNRHDADELCQFLNESPAAGSPEATSVAFLDEVQKEFNQIYRYFEHGEPPETRLAELIIQAAREGADNTSHLVKTVNRLMQEAASMGMEMNQLLQSHSQLEDKATRDPLTEVLNREGFDTQANALLAKASRYGAPVAVIYLDVDRFKAINDTLGHEFGDRALKKVASQMTATVRQNDMVGRVGGDEFAVLLYDCAEADARTVADRIVDCVARESLGKGPRKVPISLSAGLVYARPSNQERTLEALIHDADALMYEAKQAGGNQIRMRTM